MSSVEFESLLADLLAAAHEARAENLVVSTSGNLSVRLSPELFAISATRARLGSLRREQIVAVAIASGEQRRGLLGEPAGAAPSSETPMHRAVYQARPEIGAVLHCQSPAATVLACVEAPVPDLGFIPEVPVYVRVARRIPYVAPATEELAAAVAEAFRAEPELRVLLLRNHGQLVLGETAAQTVERAAFFELACRLFLDAESAGQRLRRFSAEERERLRQYRK